MPDQLLGCIVEYLSTSAQRKRVVMRQSLVNSAIDTEEDMNRPIVTVGLSVYSVNDPNLWLDGWLASSEYSTPFPEPFF